jgi:hypothetical protein
MSVPIYNSKVLSANFIEDRSGLTLLADVSFFFISLDIFMYMYIRSIKLSRRPFLFTNKAIHGRHLQKTTLFKIIRKLEHVLISTFYLAILAI